MSLRLLVIYHSFGPYHIARAKAIAKAFPDSIFLSLSNMQDAYDWEVMKDDYPFKLISLFRGIRVENISFLKINLKIIKTLNMIKPDIVLFPGFMKYGLRIVALWAKISKTPSILQIDSWYGDKPRKRWKQKLKGLMYKYFFDAAFASGENCLKYLLSLKFPKDRIWTGCDVVDNEFFSNKADEYRSNQKMRKEEGLPESKYFLCVARYAKEKDLATLLNAYKKYLISGGTWKLVLVGTGSLLNVFKKMVSRLNINDEVILREWINYVKLPAYYAFAGTLILPSKSEPWGLVANEAAACGLPLILSNKCGCVPELCNHGVNGYVFEAGNANELAEYMSILSNDGSKIAEFGLKSREMVANLTPETAASVIMEIVRNIM